MIYTSYFACNDRIKKMGLKTVSISLLTPTWTDVDDVYSILAPSKKLVYGYKYRNLTKKQYTKRYMDKLNSLDPEKIYNDLDGKVLLCYEGLRKTKKSDTFCHRHIFAKWMRSHGYYVEELEVDNINIDFKNRTINTTPDLKTIKKHNNLLFIFEDDLTRRCNTEIRSLHNTLGVVTSSVCDEYNSIKFTDKDSEFDQFRFDLANVFYNLANSSMPVVFPNDFGKYTLDDSPEIYSYLKEWTDRYLDINDI